MLENRAYHINNIAFLYLLFFKEKSYFPDESSQQTKSSDSSNIEHVNQRLFKSFVKCLDDYQGEIKHTKMIIKEVNYKYNTTLVYDVITSISFTHTINI